MITTRPPHLTFGEGEHIHRVANGLAGQSGQYIDFRDAEWENTGSAECPGSGRLRY